jgi:hypothetical protein
MNNKKEIIVQAYLEESLETAIYQYIQKNVLADKSYTLFDIEKEMIKQGWGHVPCSLFFKCYRNAVNFFIFQFIHMPQESCI